MATNHRELSSVVCTSPVEEAYRPQTKGIAPNKRSKPNGPACRPRVQKRQSNHKQSTTPNASVARGVCANAGTKYTFAIRKKPNSHGTICCLWLMINGLLQPQHMPKVLRGDDLWQETLSSF